MEVGSAWRRPRKFSPRPRSTASASTWRLTSDTGAAMQVRPELATDLQAIPEVNRRAFGQEDEGRLVDALRAGDRPRPLQRTPHPDREGCCRGPRPRPDGCGPARQKQGVGTLLGREGLRACAEAGHRIVV